MLWHPRGSNTDEKKIFKATDSNFYNESYPAILVSTLLKDKKFLDPALRDVGLTLDDERSTEIENFILAMVNCSHLLRVEGLHDIFDICRPIVYNAVAERPFAYFIGGRYDPVFADNFIRQTTRNAKIRIFTETANQSALPKDDLIKEYKESVRFGSLSSGKIGFADIKTIIDLRDDINRLAIIKYDLSYTDVEPIIMSITTPVTVCQLLIVLRDKSVVQVARLVKNLSSALYYIFAVNMSPHKRNIYYLSFMRLNCVPAYGTSNPFLAKLSDVFGL
ncbi:hypothetical protein Ddc_10267 [Ditylenchus destructor]|nr:hypothetical protein Ddc_10267 [Ditylenchus destructor]